MSKLKLILGIASLVIAGALVVLNLTLPPEQPVFRHRLWKHAMDTAGGIRDRGHHPAGHGRNWPTKRSHSGAAAQARAGPGSREGRLE